MKKRILLTRTAGVATRQRIYRVDDGLEVDEIDHFEVRRSRVFFDDVVLVTFHRQRGVVFLVVTAVVASLLSALAWFIARNEAIAGWVVFGIFAAPFWLAFLVRAITGVNVLNVYGRRTQATLRPFSQKKARRIFEELVGAVRAQSNR